MIRSFLLIGLGGAAGSMARYAVSLLLPKASTASFPIATLLVNLLGCLVIGLLAGCALRNNWMMHTGWALLATGLCGGFTTFSAFALDGLKLMESSAILTAIIYATISVAIGMMLCYVGYRITN